MPDEQQSGFDRRGDHDLLIELKTEFKGMREDIREIKDNTKDQITALTINQGKLADRVSTLENWRWYLIGGFAAAMIAIGLYSNFLNH